MYLVFKIFVEDKPGEDKNTADTATSALLSVLGKVLRE